MIVDAHTHIFGPDAAASPRRPASAADLLRDMDRHGIDHAVVLPLPGTASNDFVQAECAAHASRLTALYTPEFNDPRHTILRLQAFSECHELHGLKIHPRVQGVSVADAVVCDVLGWAEHHDIPVVFDVFAFGATLDDPRLHPMAYHAVAQRHPRLKLVLAHAGGFRVMDAFMVAKSNANVFVDVSFTPVYFRGASVAADVGFLCGRLPPGRAIYGSDYPEVDLGGHLEAVRTLTAHLDRPATDALFGGAARALFRIS